MWKIVHPIKNLLKSSVFFFFLMNFSIVSSLRLITIFNALWLYEYYDFSKIFKHCAFFWVYNFLPDLVCNYECNKKKWYVRFSSAFAISARRRRQQLFEDLAFGEDWFYRLLEKCKYNCLKIKIIPECIILWIITDQ